MRGFGIKRMELLYLNDYPRPHSELLADLSANAELLFCDVNETTMSSFATAWENGVERWVVFHDAQQSLTHLVTSGDLPAGYDAIRDSKQRDQADDDDDVDHIFDVPIDLFAALTGIRYDMTCLIRPATTTKRSNLFEYVG